MKIKFIVVSKDESFKMPKDKFEVDDSSLDISVEYVSNNADGLPSVYNPGR